MLSDHDILRQVRRLTAVYSTSKPEDEIVAAWKWVLAEDLSVTELMAAVSEYAKGSGRFFPTPGQIRQLAIDARALTGTSRTWTGANIDDTPCPVCGAVLRLLEPHEQVQTVWDGEQFVNGLPDSGSSRYGVLHDRRKHVEAGARAVGYWR